MNKVKTFQRRVSVSELLNSRFALKNSLESSDDRINFLVTASLQAIIADEDFAKLADLLEKAVAYHYAKLIMSDTHDFIFDFNRSLARAVHQYKNDDVMMFGIDYDFRKKHSFMDAYAFIIFHMVYDENKGGFKEVVDYRFIIKAN